MVHTACTHNTKVHGRCTFFAEGRCGIANQRPATLHYLDSRPQPTLIEGREGLYI